MTKLTDTVRVTTPQDNIWRHCHGCGQLSAMPPQIDRCDHCQTPVRIQRRRTAGWRMPPGAVYVGPTRYGNPFPVTASHGRAEVVARYRRWLADQPALIAAVWTELAGRDLVCWCPLDGPCHADVLLAIARGDHLDDDRSADPVGGAA